MSVFFTQAATLSQNVNKKVDIGRKTLVPKTVSVPVGQSVKRRVSGWLRALLLQESRVWENGTVVQSGARKKQRWSERRTRSLKKWASGEEGTGDGQRARADPWPICRPFLAARIPLNGVGEVAGGVTLARGRPRTVRTPPSLPRACASPFSFPSLFVSFLSLPPFSFLLFYVCFGMANYRRYTRFTLAH